MFHFGLEPKKPVHGLDPLHTAKFLHRGPSQRVLPACWSPGGTEHVSHPGSKADVAKEASCRRTACVAAELVEDSGLRVREPAAQGPPSAHVFVVVTGVAATQEADCRAPTTEEPLTFSKKKVVIVVQEKRETTSKFSWR